MKTELIQLLAGAGLSAPIRREIHPVVRVLNEKEGICEYVASDETLDCYNEVVAAGGWMFDLFEKNSPFPDSHDYSSIAKLLGRVISWRVEKGQLIEGVQWAIGLGNPAADLGWKMTVGGFLKAVSVGFVPIKATSRWNNAAEHAQAAVDLKLAPDIASKVATIYLKQQQIELSACVIGANPNALAKAYKAGCLSEEDIDTFSTAYAASKNANPAADSADAGAASPRTKLAMLAVIQSQLSNLR